MATKKGATKTGKGPGRPPKAAKAAGVKKAAGRPGRPRSRPDDDGEGGDPRAPRMLRHLGRQLGNAMRLRGVASPEELATLMGVHRNSVARLLRGDRWPSPETMARLFDVLRLPPHYFFLGMEQVLVGRQAPPPAEIAPATEPLPAGVAAAG